MEQPTYDPKLLQRVQYMESLFDQLLAALREGSFSPTDDPLQREKLRILTDYYHSPQWRSDYEADEEGGFPPNFKRGILSEDGFYLFLSQIAP